MMIFMLFRAELFTGLLFQILVLVLALFVYGRDALATLSGQLAQEAHNAPHFVVFEYALPSGHAAEANAVFNDPFELPVFVLLKVGIAEIDYRRGHFGGKGNPRAVAVEAVTHLTVMLEVLLSPLHNLRRIRSGVLPLFAADLHLFDFGS